MKDHEKQNQLRSEGEFLDRIVNRGWEFDFFQVAWHLERLHEGSEPVGGRGPARKECMRFRPEVSVGFPATDVRRIVAEPTHDADRVKYVVDVTFLGLYGVSTPLPLHYAIDILRSVDPLPTTDEIAQTEEYSGQPSAPVPTSPSPVRDFLDILHHRITSLFFRSGTKYRYDRVYGQPHRDSLTAYLLWLIGYAPDWGEEALGVDPIRMIRYAGLLTQRPRSAIALEGMVSDYWSGMPVKVQQFIGRWVPLTDHDMAKLGENNSQLGVDLVVGEEVFDLCGALRLTLGPLDWPTYLEFLPDRPNHAQTRSLAGLFSGDPLALELEISILPGEIPEMQLTSGDTAARLGYTCWVTSDAMPETSVTFHQAEHRCDAEPEPHANRSAAMSA